MHIEWNGRLFRDGKTISGEADYTWTRKYWYDSLGLELLEYTGQYRSDELDITFIVEIDKERIIVRNDHKHFCSMDLYYTPTIKDNFIAYDPHPKSSQITFLRKDGRIESFVYRDYDGDGREAIKFDKVDR